MHSVLHVCPDWSVMSIYTLRCLLITIHACGSIQFIYLSALRPPIRVMSNDQKQSEGSLATILSLESPTTSQPQANQLSQSNEDVLAQVDQFTENYELESGHSLRVKGNLSVN